MHGRVLLDDLIEDLKPRRRRGPTRKRVVVGLNLATSMLAHLVLRRPALAPLFQALAALLQPSEGAASGEAERVLAHIRRLRGRLRLATTDEETTRLRQQIDTLTDLLTGGDE
jgi:hypothetical protein